MDYKWIKISNNNDDKKILITNKKLEENKQIHHKIGTITITKLASNKESTAHRLCVSDTQINKLKVSTVKQYKKTTPSINNKKKFRDSLLSPLQQEYWPILIGNDFTWIPGSTNAKTSGNIAITFQSKLGK